MAGSTITAEQAAKRLGISLRTLLRWRDAGRISEAPRAGRTVMFYAKDVDALYYAERGMPTPETLGLEEIYARLAALDSWEDVDALRRDVAATICATAEDKQPLEDAYRAACAMAATHPDEWARGNWARTARQYGAWLGRPDTYTEGLIGKMQSSPYMTYEAAKAKADAAPRDPAQAIATRALGGGGPKSVNCA